MKNRLIKKLLSSILTIAMIMTASGIVYAEETDETVPEESASEVEEIVSEETVPEETVSEANESEPEDSAPEEAVSEEIDQEPTVQFEESQAASSTVNMYRLYNPNSGEHFYTSNTAERDMLIGVGWSYEGVGWIAPSISNTPVYRLYNQYGGEHHYTTSVAERDMLISVGWSYEGIGWYSDDSCRVPLYRQYNPNAFANNHNYTTSLGENDWLVSIGWRAEGIGWYGVGAGYSVPSNPSISPTTQPYSEPATINTTSITLVVADERRTQEFTPEFAVAYEANKVDSFQLVVTNAHSVTYRVISGDAEVSSTGLVTPGRDVWWTRGDSVWYSNPRHTIADDAIESRIDYFPGESVIRVTADGQTFDVNVTVVDFASEYTDSIIDQFIEANNLNSPDMSVEEKAYLITQYVAHNYDYSIYYGLSAEMVTHGCGDCIGSMNLIIRIASRLGLTVWPRDARSDWGAGSGHMNAVIYDEENGLYYVCDAGTSGTAPRAFIMGATDTLPVGTICN